MKKILSCDWGTSSFRLRLVNADTLEALAEESNSQGMSATYGVWQKTGKPESERFLFYYENIHSAIKQIEQKTNSSLAGIPLMISGMASSSIGMMELPYKEIPILTDGSDLEIKIVEADRMIWLISGIRSTDDVMRGEETKLIGSPLQSDAGEHLFILPGTHSKHARIRDENIVGIETYMTGEYFDLLATKSILSGSVESGGDFVLPANREYFEKGVNDSLQANLLHQSFLVRINSLFGKCNQQQNYFYLSGLLIGTELKDLSKTTASGITLMGDSKLNAFYKAASEVLGISLTRIENADDALIRGQVRLLSYDS